MTATGEIENRAIVFDIWGDYAHFRKIETTTSSLTYSIPTGTALAGMISAIIGLERDSYYDLFSPENTRVAVQILNEEMRKTRINLTMIDTKKGWFLRDIGENPRTIIPCEFVKDPRYRIYVWTRRADLAETLRDFLRGHKSYYTPCLGTANLIADFAYVGEFEMKKLATDEPIHSVARIDKGELVIEDDKRYIVERIPVHMDQNRVVQDFAEIVFEQDRKPVNVSGAESYNIGSEVVSFL